MGRQESDNLINAEACICKPLNDSVDGVGGFWDGQVGGRSNGWRATEEEVQLRSAWAVCGTNSSSQVNEVTSGQVRRLEDRELLGGDVVDSRVAL